MSVYTIPFKLPIGNVYKKLRLGQKMANSEADDWIHGIQFILNYTKNWAAYQR